MTALGNLLPLLVFAVSAGLAVFARFKKWTVEIPEPPPPATEELVEPRPFREQIKRFASRHRWWLILAAALASVLLFAFLFAPPRLVGGIPPDPFQPGRPFYNLRWQRAFLRNKYDALAAWTCILASLVTLAPVVIAIRKKSRLHAEAALLLASLTLAILAQWTLGDKEIRNVGATLYVFAILGFAYWAWLARARLARDLEPAPAKRGLDLALVFSLLALTAFGRFYALNSVPYGIEGDEAKWTSEAVNLGILGASDTTGEYHRDALPVSFYLQTPFHKLLGPSLLAARITVAFMSVLASLAFYWLLRQIAPLPLAALATFLLAVSIFDISASRLANVESFVKIGAVLPLALLAWAIGVQNLPILHRSRETSDSVWQPYAIAGVALALAALTYDTLWPIGGVCLMLVIVELWKRESPLQEKAKSIAALFAPVTLVLPVLIPYFNSRVGYYELGKKGWEAGALVTLWDHLVSVLESWFVVLRPDFLYNRDGPLLNAALLPWLAAGVVAALLTVQKRSARWMLVWVALIVFPIPIVTNSPLGRVYYPALPAVYGLIAIGLYLFWKEVQRISAAWLKPILIVVALVPIVWLPLTNYFIYFNEVSEAGDRQMRREIGEIAAASADTDTLLLLAAVPNADEPLNNEYQMVELFMLGKLTEAQVKEAYRRVALDEVMPAIFGEFADRKRLDIVLDRNSPGQRENRDALKNGLIECFPRGHLVEGIYFDHIVLDKAARAASDCVPVTIQLTSYFSSELQWELSAGSASSLALRCDRQRTNYQWIEAEEIPLSPGWQVQINFASGWTGNGFLMDNYGSQFLFYELDASFAGTDLYLWARTYKRVVDHSPALVTLNGATSTFANTAEESLNQWIWERVGPFPNNGATVRITIARPYEENLQNYMAIFMDALIVTDDASFSPETSLTDPMPHQIFAVNTDSRSGFISPKLPPGQYTCRVELTSTENVVDAFGRQPVISNDVEFSVP